MSNHEKSGPLDTAIDEAVRELMQVDPRPGLRHRVGVSIRTQPLHGRRFGSGFAWAAALAVLVLVSALLLRSPEPSRPAPPQVVAAPPAAPVLPPAAAPVADAPRETPATRVRRLSPSPEAIFGPRTARVMATGLPLVAGSAAEGADAPLEPAATPWRLPPIAPITIAPLSLPPLTIDPLTFGSLPVRK